MLTVQFQCFVPPPACTSIFMTPKERRHHLIGKHSKFSISLCLPLPSLCSAPMPFSVVHRGIPAQLSLPNTILPDGPSRPRYKVTLRRRPQSSASSFRMTSIPVEHKGRWH